MDTMNDLLICAMAVGKNDPHKATIKARNIHGSVRDGVWLVDTEEWYDPRTNDAQAMELLKWIFSEMVRRDDRSFRKEWILIIWQNFIRAKSLNEAIIKAVVAMEDTHECNT